MSWIAYYVEVSMRQQNEELERRRRRPRPVVVPTRRRRLRAPWRQPLAGGLVTRHRRVRHSLRAS